MKSLRLLIILFFINLKFLNAQAVLDTVSTGAGYSQQVWYNLETDKEVKQPIANWDLAFESQFRRNAAIWVNPLATLYAAIAPVSAFNDIKAADTLKAVTPQYNSDTSWFTGAFNRTGDQIFNYGWGNYNIVTHNVQGDSVYLLKRANGEWKKIVIIRLTVDTAFVFKYANLDGSNEKTFEFRKNLFKGKNFGYFSFATDNTVDREPLAKDWHLHFTRFWGRARDSKGVFQDYSLQGVFTNEGVTVAKVFGDTSKNNFSGLTFSKNISTIGADWKTFDLTKNRWVLNDSVAYFVKLADGKIYKLIFTGFGGAANGNYIFTRQALQTTGVKDVYNGTASLAVYPNPVTSGNITLVFDLGKNTRRADIQILNVNGQVVHAQNASVTEGVQQLTLSAPNLNAGMYFIRLSFDNRQLVQKIIVK